MDLGLLLFTHFNRIRKCKQIFVEIKSMKPHENSPLRVAILHAKGRKDRRIVDFRQCVAGAPKRRCDDPL
jgi:hypothetical protein